MNTRLYVDSLYLSPYALSAFVSLTEKSLPFEVATVDLEANGAQAAAFVTKSLTRRVPTLEQDGFSLSESSAISEYLDETAPGVALYPQDPRQRARARQIQAWLRSDLLPLREERPSSVVFQGVEKPPLSPPARAAAASLFFAAHEWLAGRSDDLFGGWGIADVDLAMMLNRLVVHGDVVPGNLADYARRQWQRPSVQAWVRRPRPVP